jgi:hypothetical protein
MQRAFVNSPRSLRSSGNLEVYAPMPMPLPLPDRVEIAEYLAQYVLRDIEVGGFTHDDLRDSPEVGCLEQVAAELGRLRATVPSSICLVLGKAGAAGRVLATRALLGSGRL